MQNQYKAGDKVRIVKGYHNGKDGEILEIEQMPDSSMEQKYVIKLPDKPFGVTLPDSCIEPSGTSQF